MCRRFFPLPLPSRIFRATTIDYFVSTKWPVHLDECTGENAFEVQWTSSLSKAWSNAAPPLDLTVSTNSQTTVSAPIIAPVGFYRVVQGFGLQSLHGAWIILPAGVTNVGQVYFVADGIGTITNFGAFNLDTPPGSYSVSNNGSLTLTFYTMDDGTNSADGQFMPPRQIVFTGSSSNSVGTAMPVQDASLCAGIWNGTLSETNDPNGLSNYSLGLTVTTNGAVSVSGDFSGTGWMFALAATNGALAGFFKTGLSSTNHYNQFSISGTLSGTNITGKFDTDSGMGTNRVAGTVSLSR